MRAVLCMRMVATAVRLLRALEWCCNGCVAYVERALRELPATSFHALNIRSTLTNIDSCVAGDGDDT